MRVAGLILAGGAGRRMGGADKAFLTIDGQPLIAGAIRRLAPQVRRLAISANGDPGRFSAFGLPVLADRAAEGPLAGILAGLDWAADSGSGWVATAAVDTPFFPQDFVARCMSLAQDGRVVLAETPAGLHPTFGLWPVGAAPDLRQALARGHRKLREVAARIGSVTCRFDDDAAFFNINRPEDLRAARDRAQSGT
jgi:molybdenum cofactor guanylyltransferase